jgi:hypothetical protein
VDAARRVMIHGAGVAKVLSEVLLLVLLAQVYLSRTAWLFRWE